MGIFETEYWEEIKNIFLNMPFIQVLNVSEIDIEKGTGIIRMQMNDTHLNTNHSLHGGVLATLLDTVSGISVRSLLDSSRTAATVNISVNYVRPAFEGEIMAKGKVKTIGKNISTVEAEVFDQNNVLLANSIATFVVIDKKK